MMKGVIMKMMTCMMKDAIMKIKDIIIVMEDMREKSHPDHLSGMEIIKDDMI
jgi:hypothetical protein